jgi:hypothetical protein
MQVMVAAMALKGNELPRKDSKTKGGYLIYVDYFTVFCANTY